MKENTCNGCEYLNVSYRDSGHYYCAHRKSVENIDINDSFLSHLTNMKFIGYDTDTPSWCPLPPWRNTP